MCTRGGSASGPGPSDSTSYSLRRSTTSLRPSSSSRSMSVGVRACRLSDRSSRPAVICRRRSSASPDVTQVGQSLQIDPHSPHGRVYAVADRTPVAEPADARHATSAGPVAGEVEPAPGQHRHASDATKASPTTTRWTVRAATRSGRQVTSWAIIIQSGNHSRMARLTDMNQYEIENASTWMATQDASAHSRRPRHQPTTTTPIAHRDDLRDEDRRPQRVVRVGVGGGDGVPERRPTAGSGRAPSRWTGRGTRRSSCR